jgi:hypothetical protein
MARRTAGLSKPEFHDVGPHRPADPGFPIEESMDTAGPTNGLVAGRSRRGHCTCDSSGKAPETKDE